MTFIQSCPCAGARSDSLIRAVFLNAADANIVRRYKATCVSVADITLAR
jgi:hypothetical protein